MAHRPTPHSIAVAALIALHCQENSPLYQDGDGTEFKLVDSFLRDVLLPRATTSITTTAPATPTDGMDWVSLHGRSVQSLLRELQVATVDKANHVNSYNTASSQACNDDHDDENEGGGGDTRTTTVRNSISNSNNNIARHFHGWLMVATSSIDALTDLMTAIQRAVLSDGCVDATSVHGVFLRSCVLGYDELSFASVIALWNDFAQQVRHNGSSNDDNKSDEAAAYHHHQQPQWMISKQQVESAILEQCWNTASLVPGEQSSVAEMQRDLRHILEMNPELAAAHLLRFILCLKSGERVGAMDALHQYMDYAVSSSSSSSLADHGGGEDMLQFAAILRAVLHDHFGERRLVVSATDEAVRVAQQSQDTGAVAFALGWLSVYCNDDDDDATGNDDTANNRTSWPTRQSSSLMMMQRCVQRAATAGNLRPLWAGGHLVMAMQSQSWTPLVQVVSDPAAVASTATTTGSNDARSGSGRGDRPTHASYLDERYTGTTATAAAARQKLVAAGLYSRYGETTLSAQASVSALYCQNDHLSATDVTVAVHNLCATATSGSTAWMDWNAVLERRPLAATTTSSEDCIYGNVLRTSINLRERYRLPIDGVFQFDLALVLHEWAVRRRDMGHAEALLTAMESHLHPRVENYEEIKFDMETQKALFLSRQERWNDATLFLTHAIARRKSAKQYGATARLLLQLAMVHLESSPTQFMNALHPLLECLTTCKAHKMDGLEDSALLILAQVHLRMGQCQRTVQILQVILPRLLQHSHVWLQAEAYLTLAKCYMTKAKDCCPQSPKQCKVFQAALHELRRSVLLFLKCHDCHRLQEVYYLTALIYNVLPDSQHLRDDAAKAFVQVHTHSASPIPSDILAAMSSRDGILELANRPLRVSAD